MPPKGGAKQAAKKAEKIVEDKTFGLKNKNKSTKVQKFVQSVTVQAKHRVGLDHKTEAQKKAELKAKKDAKTREEEELRMLFSQLQHGATKRSKAEEAAAQAEQERLAADKDAQQGWVDQDMTGKPLEEVIEYQRAKLAYEGKAKTPVTAESFAKWKAEKAEQKKKENAEKVARELAKKAKGKGLSVLSGKALFEYDATLFVDDEEADASGVDVSKLAGLMEADEEEGAQGEGGGDEAMAVAVQEQLYLDGGDDDDLDDLDDDDDEDEAAAAGGGGGATRQLHEEEAETKPR